MENCFEWQEESLYSTTQLKHLFEHKKFTDCVFVVDSEIKQREILAHKLVLAKSSPVFERVFYGTVPFQDAPIIVPDVDANAFHAMIKFIYTDKVNLESVKEAFDIWCAAHKYMIFRLFELCTKYIWHNISFEYAIVVHKYAELFENKLLARKCFECICLNTSKILKHPSFFDIESKLLIKLFQQNQLNIDSELQLFSALEKFCETHKLFSEEQNQKHVENESDHQQSETQEVEQSASNINLIAMKKDKTERMMTVRKAVNKIRFLTLSVEEFTKGGPFASKILEDSEKDAILSNISSVNEHVLPMDFSISRKKRDSSFANSKYISIKHYFYEVKKYTEDGKCSFTFQVNGPIWIEGFELTGIITQALIFVKLLNANETLLTAGCCISTNGKIFFADDIFIQSKINYTLIINVNSGYQHPYREKPMHNLCKEKQGFSAKIHGPEMEFMQINNSIYHLKSIFFHYPYSKDYNSIFSDMFLT